jgi:hypothetical protein
MGKYPDLQVGYLTEQTRLNFDRNSENTPLLCGGDVGFILIENDIIVIDINPEKLY